MSAERKPPRNVNVLRRWVGEHSQAEGIAVMRLQRWISYMVLAAALDRVQDEHDQPLFVAKGGIAMELRLRLRARATKDYDATFRSSIDTMLAKLDEALQEPYCDFTMTRTEPDYQNEDGFIRLEIKLAYRGRSWQTIVLEVMPANGAWAGELETVPAIDITDFGLDGPEMIPCISVRHQIAQKIHACTETFPDGERPNDRSRDLIDLLLLRDLIRDLPAVREACVNTFEIRGKHPWPPGLVIPDHWIEQYAREAEELEFEITDVSVAAERVREMIAEIDTTVDS